MANAGEIKSINTQAVLRALGQGTKSVSTLARETGLSFPTVGRAMEALVEAGECLPQGQGGSTGGRCARLFGRNPLHQVALCLRFEGGELGWFVADLFGAPLQTGREPCQEGLLEKIEGVLAGARARYPQLGAVAMGIAGTVHAGTVTKIFRNSELRGVNLLARLQALSGLPAAVVGDMAAATAGLCARRPTPPQSMVSLYLGQQGMGAGVVLAGKVWLGASEFAGEVHYLPIAGNIEFAENHFAGADMVDYYCKVICSYAALLNPQRVVLYQNALLCGREEAVRAACARALPPQALPQIEVSRDFDADYIRGLGAVACGLLAAPGTAP